MCHYVMSEIVIFIANKKERNKLLCQQLTLLLSVLTKLSRDDVIAFLEPLQTMKAVTAIRAQREAQNSPTEPNSSGVPGTPRQILAAKKISM